MIQITNWGKDHWSTFAYVETLAVENKGIAVPDNVRMRTNEKTHPHLVGHLLGNMGGSKYPTRLKNKEILGHDDWDCLDDAVEEGLLEDVGTGLNRAFKLTEKGMKVAAMLREHKMKGGTFSTFELSWSFEEEDWKPKNEKV